MKRKIFFVLITLLPICGWSSNGYFLKNKGQFPTNVLYKARLNYGAFFIEKDRFTCVVLDPSAVNKILGHPNNDGHQHEKRNFSSHSRLIKGQAFSIVFEGANQIANHKGLAPLNFKVNSFIGNKKEKWATNLSPFQEIYIKEIYPNTDLKIYFKDNSIKYDFILHPNANPDNIVLKYIGLKGIDFSRKKLSLLTQVGTIYDEAPYSYQVSNPNEKINTSFKKINSNTFGISVETGEITEKLIIDPQLNFVTFTGSTTDNWGYTATFNAKGYGFAGGIDFGIGYPTHFGAFQSLFGGGSIDMSITKFSPDGKNIAYSTYIGGLGLEAPHSMVVNSKDQLVIYGVTSSLDYPATGYDKTFNGGSNVLASNVLDFTNGTDIVVTVLDKNGDNIIGSTYYGGSSNDALNDVNELSGLFHNYGDVYRGEVIVDKSDNIIIASVTSSTNLPTPGGFQTAFGGGNQDGCIAKFSPNLSNLIWGSYFGGSGDDACYATKQNSNEDIYITGGTTSADLNISSTANKTTYSNQIDGYLARINSAGNVLKNCTYLGTSKYDQSYFVEVDYEDFVYCFGQTYGDMPISTGAYNVANSGQFLQKYKEDLSAIEASTVIGSGIKTSNLVPGAFMVSNCKEIYISGWGGLVNYNVGGNTKSLPITNDAIQKTTDGSDFYLALLGPDFSSLKYGTYIGGSNLEEHVDGGTSRFDRSGTVYQAVCAGCGGSSAFPITPSAYSKTNNSENCNLALIKMDISKLTANIAFTKDSAHCITKPVNFNNQSTGGTSYKWIYPDKSVSLDYNGQYVFKDTGNYVVSLISIDSTQCPYSDTANIDVKIVGIPNVDVKIDTFVCINSELNLKTTGGPSDTNYNWWANNIPLPFNSEEITVIPTETTEYKVKYENKCGSKFSTVKIPVYKPPEGKYQSDTICENGQISFALTNSDDYEIKSLDDINFNLDNDSIYFNANSDNQYQFETKGFCGDALDTLDVVVIKINPKAWPDTIICSGQPIQLFSAGGYEYNWISSKYLTDSTLQNPIANPEKTFPFIVKISKGKCFKLDTALVNVHPKQQQLIDNEYTIHYGESVILDLNHDFSYNWRPAKYLSCKNCAITNSKPEEDILYYFSYQDSKNCLLTDSVKINVIFPLYIANTLTPNGDGKNDIFYAKSYLLKKFEMDIFDRWGVHLFHSDDINHGWDGTYKGNLQQQDVYVWKIRYTKIHSNKVIQKVGHVNLIK